MSDPVSIAGTAVGVVSLGITVCQGLVSYYASWKDYEVDIKHTHGYLEDVSNKLQAAHTVLQTGSFPAEVKQQVESAISICVNHIDTLNTKLAKVRSTKLPVGIRDKVKSNLLRAQYPFKEKTLRKLQDSTTALQTNLVVALNLLSVDSLSSLQPQIGVINSNVDHVKVSVEGVSQSLPAILNKTVSIECGVRRVEGGVECIDQRLHGLEPSISLLPSMQAELQTLPSSLAASRALQLDVYKRESAWRKQQESRSAEILQGLSALDNQMKTLLLQLISRPSMLQSALDEVNHPVIRLDNENTLHRKRPKPLGTRFTVCTCPLAPKKSTGEWKLGRNLQVFTKATATHSRGCPLFRTSQQTNTLGIKYTHSALLLKVALELSLTIKRGAGGVSISPSLQVRGLVRNDSPAFKLIFGVSKHTDVSHLIHQLQVLLIEGKAGPRDVDPYGRTLIHVAAVISFRFPVASRQKCLLSLVQLGSPLDEEDIFGRNALTEILQSERYKKDFDLKWQVAPLLYQVLETTPDGSCGPFEAYLFYHDHEEYAGVYGCGSLSEAVLSRSEPYVERILASNPGTINDQNNLGQTPLHLSAGWPWGVDRLLTAGALVDIADRDGLYPIYSAAAIEENLETTKKILAAGSPVCGLRFLFGYYGDHIRRVYPCYGRKYLFTSQGMLFHALVTALVDRRKQLAKLAEDVLSPMNSSRLVGSVAGILDRNAYEVYCAITDSGVTVQPALRVSKGDAGVYQHFDRWTLEELNMLYDFGFHDVDAPSPKGATALIKAAACLEVSEDTSVIEWLLSKGADMLGKLTSTGATQLHFIAREVGQSAAIIDMEHLNVGAPLQSGYNVEQSLAALDFGLNLILREDYLGVNDNCNCACLVQGCSSFTIVLKECLRYYCFLLCKRDGFGRLDCARCKAKHRTILFLFLEWALEVVYGGRHIPDILIDEITRYCLFAELGLTHTCCNLRIWSNWMVSQNWMHSLQEISEIHDEEKELIAELEDLCEEARFRRAGYEGSFFNFLEVFLQEVRDRKPKPISKLAIREMEEIGVVLEPGTVVVCDSEYDSGEEVEYDSDEDVFEDAAVEVVREDNE